MRRVDIVLVLDLLDVDAHAVLGKGKVLVANVFAGLLLDLGDAEVDLVADEAEAANDGEEDDEGDDLADY